MTIGEKIKYYRQQIGLTQKQLSEATNIHLVSIKKYETNKMQPQLPQIEKIAAALGIGTNALLDMDNFQLRCNSVADFMGILILLNRSNMVYFDGERDDNGMIKPNTLSVKFAKNHLLDKILRIQATVDNKPLTVPSEFISIEITDQELRSKIVKWEKMLCLYQEALQRQESELNDSEKALNDDIIALKEKLELEMQHSFFTFTNSSKAQKKE